MRNYAPCWANSCSARDSAWNALTRAISGSRKALEPEVDLVVLDVMLPGLDGFDILRRLRRRAKCR